MRYQLHRRPLDGVTAVCFVCLHLVHHLQSLVAPLHGFAYLADPSLRHLKCPCYLLLQLVTDKDTVGNVYLLLQ